MGYYLSEMEGEPFTTTRKVKYDEKKVLAQIKEVHKKMPKNLKVTSVIEQWIITDRKRVWAEIHYSIGEQKYFFHTTKEIQ